MTPQNGRFQDDPWRRDIDENLDRIHARIDGLSTEMRAGYVSKDYLSAIVATMKVITDNLVKVTDRNDKIVLWLFGLIAAGFFSALARIVYTNAK